MNRRQVVTALVGVASACQPVVAAAQTPSRVVRLGMVSQNPRTVTFTAAFERRLRELGYAEGRNLVIEFIDTHGQVDRIEDGMKEVVRRNVDILLAGGPELSLKSALAATKALPIVMIAIDYDPFALGYVRSLARPGGNVTGLYFQQTELAPKRVELIKELMPSLNAATVFWDRFSADQWKATEAAAPASRVRLAGIDLEDQPYDYEQAIVRVPQENRSAVLVMQSPVFFRDRLRIAQFALKRKVATIFALREFTDAGGLISYGANISALYVRAAEMVDRIVQGSPPSDLPIEQPTRFELVVNIKTAKALGLEIPPTLLARADKVIE